MRLVTDPRVSVSLRDLELYWTLEDVYACHDTLDALDAAQQEAYELSHGTKRSPR